MDNTFMAILTGTSPFEATELDEVVAKRFEKIKDGEAFAERDASHPDSHGMGFCYDGNRCRPESLGWRFRQMHGRATDSNLNLGEIKSGLWDEQIAATYHEAASSEYYYRYEKDWG